MGLPDRTDSGRLGAKRLLALLPLWLLGWAGINGGPWLVEQPLDDLSDWINALRSLAPLFAAALWLLWRPLTPGRVRIPTLAEALWIGYAVLSLQAALLTGAQFSVWYWAVAYLGVFAIIEWSIGTEDPVARAITTNRLAWLLTTLFLIWMLVVARDVLLVESKLGLTAHGLVQRTNLGELGPISRSTGMARLAAVPAVIGLAMLLARRGLARLPWALLFLAAMLTIWWVQARQGVLGIAFALSLVVWLSGHYTRLFGTLTLVLAAFVLIEGVGSDDWQRYLLDYATRGEGLSAFDSMTGRDLIWRRGWSIVTESPWIGFGPQADRRLLGLNAQNGLLYASLAAGYPGAALYLGGILWGWVLFARAVLRGYARDPEERLFLTQVGGIMAYLTIRTIPENTAALFSVDLLLYAPLLAYLGTLERERGPTWRQARLSPRSPRW